MYFVSFSQSHLLVLKSLMTYKKSLTFVFQGVREGVPSTKPVLSALMSSTAL